MGFTLPAKISIEDAIMAAIVQFNNEPSIPVRLKKRTELFDLVPATEDGSPRTKSGLEDWEWTQK